MCFNTGTTTGLLLKGVRALLEDKSFSLKTDPAMLAHNTAEQLLVWIPGHEEEVAKFEKKLVTSLCTCMQTRAKSQKVRREKMWTSYHTLRTSTGYRSDWQTLASSISVSKVSPIFCQYVGNFIFKELIRVHHPITQEQLKSTPNI